MKWLSYFNIELILDTLHLAAWTNTTDYPLTLVDLEKEFYSFCLPLLVNLKLEITKPVFRLKDNLIPTTDYI